MIEAQRGSLSPTCFYWAAASGCRAEFRFLLLLTRFCTSNPADLLKPPLQPPASVLTAHPVAVAQPELIHLLSCLDHRCQHRDPAAGGLHHWSHGRDLCSAHRRGQGQVPGSDSSAGQQLSKEVQQHAGGLQDHRQGRGGQRPVER